MFLHNFRQQFGVSMNTGPIPAVAIGTLSGNLPKNATTAAGPLPGANGAPAFAPVGLNQDDAVKGVTLTRLPDSCSKRLRIRCDVHVAIGALFTLH